MKILLPIKPEFVEKIFNGTKKYEYRKIVPKLDVESIIIYATSPIKAIVGEVKIVQKILTLKNELWNITKKYSGITKEYYDSYFKNEKIAFAFKLGEVKIYKKVWMIMV